MNSSQFGLGQVFVVDQFIQQEEVLCPLPGREARGLAGQDLDDGSFAGERFEFAARCS